MNESSVLDTPRTKRKTLLSKVFSQLSIQNENTELSIEQKGQLIENYKTYPQKLKTYAGNYILTEREKIVNAAEANLRDFLRPIEARQRQVFSTQHQRDCELGEAYKRKQVEEELCQRVEEKNQIALKQLQTIVDVVENKLKLMEAGGYLQ